MNPVYFLVLAFAIAGGGTMIGYFYSDQNWLLPVSFTCFFLAFFILLGMFLVALRQRAYEARIQPRFIFI